MSDLRVLLRLLALFRPYAGWMLAGAALSALTVLAHVALMATAGGFLAGMAIAGLAGQLINYFLPAAAIRLFAILRTAGRYLERLVTHEATFRLLAELRLWLFRRMEPLAPAALETHRGADLVSRLQGDVDTLQHAYLRFFAPVGVALACGLAIAAGLAVWSPGAALTVLALLATAGALVPLAVRRANAADGPAQVAARAALRVGLVDALQGATELCTAGASTRHLARLIAESDGLCAAQHRSAVRGALAEGAVGLCAGLAMWGVALIAIAAVARGDLGPADVPLLALAALAAFEAVAPLPLAFQRLPEVTAAARRIFALADLPEPIPSPAAPRALPAHPGITLRGVGMRYGDALRPALEGIDLDLPPGHRIALLGASGAGKSSLLRLLVRFADYGPGEITVGGVDLRRADPEALRTRIAVVSQDSRLFNATIRQNLQLASPAASDEEMAEALHTARLAEVVAALPQGIDSWIGEAGARLSTGQARRLAVARALLRKAPVMLLDEPAEGLDPETARDLMLALVQAAPEASLLIITHAPEEVAGLVDEILRLEDGRIVSRARCRRITSGDVPDPGGGT